MSQQTSWYSSSYNLLFPLPWCRIHFFFVCLLFLKKKVGVWVQRETENMICMEQLCVMVLCESMRTTLWYSSHWPLALAYLLIVPWGTTCFTIWNNYTWALFILVIFNSSSFNFNFKYILKIINRVCNPKLKHVFFRVWQAIPDHTFQI